ncbi:uncharacterized protein LOC123523595 [Mercenaria mercenaria]|uniref:uncharacterized protein LOC123523595 n=1 Tax=Mercenaria mercenaria TaxID=6596 RepID=UPI001E1DF277|nr:uncharacterized protein LOC123523595 [Mercenaria mercenaria]
MKCLTLCTLLIILKGCMFQESGESEYIKFHYEPHTHMMIVTRQSTCYMFVLTSSEMAMVHEDSSLRTLELHLLAKINDPSTQLTTVPHFSLHTNLQRQCGKDMLHHYIIQ